MTPAAPAVYEVGVAYIVAGIALRQRTLPSHPLHAAHGGRRI